MTQPNVKAKAIIDSNRFMTVATITDNNEPWNSPLAFYHFDNDYTLYWASWTNNQHSKNIRANGKAFIVIYDSKPVDGKVADGVYIQAAASEITNEHEAKKAAQVFGEDPYNPSEGTEYLGNKPRRIYRAVPQKIWTNGDSELNGNFIDIRQEANK